MSAANRTRFDVVRRSASPLQLDVVESFARGQLSRREFIQRGTLIGLSIPAISAVLVACGQAAPSATGPTATASASAAATAQIGGTIRAAIQRPVTLDPVAMQDPGAYAITAQSLEFLCAQDASGDQVNLSPGLAESWSPNADGTVWTFKLRQGVTWHDGTPFSATDVVATMERLVASGNSGLAGVLESGGAVATDPATVTFTLARGNGNFPYLVSIYNAQSLITPADYAAGTTLDGRPTGTGPWKLVTYDAQTGATFERNTDWWGGQTPLDGTEFAFFDDTAAMVVGYQGDQVDFLQFDVQSGKALIDDPGFTLIAAPSSFHRQVWMRTDQGTFADVRVRQALALTWDRDALIQQLFDGRAQVGNDHVIWTDYPYFDSSIPQRNQDIDKAKALLADAGAEGLTATLNVIDFQDVPDLAVLLKSQAELAGITLNVNVEGGATFYSGQWCPPEPASPPCSGAAELGIVEYGHRATPDVFLNAALKTDGVWNPSQYRSEAFDAAFAEFQSAVGVDAQKAACTKIETTLNEDVPVGLPYFPNYLAGSSSKFTGVIASAGGQMSFAGASRV